MEMNGNPPIMVGKAKSNGAPYAMRRSCYDGDFPQINIGLTRR
jgi:hypothetical protein